MPIYEAEVDVDDYGTFTGSFRIPQSQKEATEYLSVTVNGNTIINTSLIIASYHKPLYDYTVAAEKTRYFAGESVKFTVIGKDYSGNPASNKEVKLELMKGEVSTYPKGVYQEGYYSSEGTVDTKTVKLDANGKYDYKFTPLRTGSDAVLGYTLVVSEKGEQYGTSNYASVLVAQSKKDVVINFDKNAYLVGKNANVEFKFRNLWGLSPAASTSFAVNVVRTWTESVLVGNEYNPETKTTDPMYSYVQRSENVLTSVPLTTDQNGVARLQVPNLSEGTYRVDALFDNGMVSSDSFWVSGGANLEDFYGISVNFEQDKYQVGDKAVAGINVREGGDTVVYIESSKLNSWKKFSFAAAGSQNYEFNVDESMHPYVAGRAFKVVDMKDYGVPEYGKTIVTSATSSQVSSEQGKIDVKITADKNVYAPGDEVTLTVETKDNDGNAISAQVGVYATDLALIEAAGASKKVTDIKSIFYHARLNTGEVAASNPNFLVGGAGGAGSGGDQPRADFKDTALWSPATLTDNSGKATIKFTLPDNLTTWKIFGYAVDKKDKFGMYDTQITTSLSRFVNIEMPKFVRANDKFGPFVEVSNYGAEFTGKVRVTCVGCTTENWESDELKIPKSTRKVVNVPLQVKSKAAFVDVKVEFLMKSDTEWNVVDAVQKVIPVYSIGLITRDVQSSLLKNDSSELSFKVDFGGEYRADLNSAELTVSKGFSINGFDYPVDPSSRSTIDLSYSLLHNAFIYKYYDELKPDISKADLLARVQVASDKILVNQSTNGGFSWFGYDAVSVEASTLAAEALAAAQKAGLTVNPFVLSELTRYFTDVLKDASIQYTIRLFHCLLFHTMIHSLL